MGFCLGPNLFGEGDFLIGLVWTTSGRTSGTRTPRIPYLPKSNFHSPRACKPGSPWLFQST